MNLILQGIKLIYVFDGEPPELKGKTHEIRREAKESAKEKYEIAKQMENVEDMGKYSRSEVHLDEQKIKESKELLEAMGIATIQAPGEGEAQASIMSQDPDIYAVASQDYDCLMFKAPKLIQNLSLSRKRKTATGYVDVHPQLIELKEVLNELEINQEQLICIGIICGTDYNPGGVKGLGPKKSLKIVKEYKTKEKIFEALDRDEKFEKYELNFDWPIIYEEIENPKTEKNTKIAFPNINEEKIKEILTQYEFSEKRIDSQLEKLEDLKKEKQQTTLF